MSGFEKFLDRLFDLLEKYLPGFIVGLGVGYKRGRQGAKETKGKLLEQELETELVKNELKVVKDNLGRSDGDVISDAISEGRDLSERDRK